LPAIDPRSQREDAVFDSVRNVLIVASLFDPFTWQFPDVIFTSMLGPGKWDAAETVMRIVYNARKALRPAQVFPATPSRMDVSPAAAKRKLTEQEEMQQLRDSMISAGGAGTARDPPVKSAPLANEVDRLKKLALEYPCQMTCSGSSPST
jgi:hypothetical protein